MDEYKITHLNNGNILLEKIVINTKSINNNDLDNYFDIFNTNKKLHNLLEIIFNKKEDLNLINILKYNELRNLSDNQKKYITLKFNELQLNQKKELLNILLTRDNVYELNTIFNKSNSGSGYLKDQYIELILLKLELSLIIDIRNVHIVKYYENHLYDSEHYNDNVFTKMIVRNFFVPEHYITNEICILAIMNYDFSITKIPINILTDDLCYLYLLYHRRYASFIKIIEYIPEQFRTEKVCKLYIQLYGKEGLNYIPKNLLDNINNDELCKLSIKYVNLSLLFT